MDSKKGKEYRSQEKPEGEEEGLKGKGGREAEKMAREGTPSSAAHSLCLTGAVLPSEHP